MWSDLRLVEQFGPFLDSQAKEETLRDLLIRSLLKIRVKKGGVHCLKLNRAQREYSRRCSEAQHRAEGAAAGNHDLRRGAIFHPDDHAAGDADGAGGAQPGVGGGDFQYRASLSGEPAGIADAARARW